MSANLAFKENFDSEKAKGALEDILAAFDQPENFARLQDAKDLAGNDMLKHMQVVFPLLTQIEMGVIESYGFTRDGEALSPKCVLPQCASIIMFHSCFHGCLHRPRC
ncbi:protein C10 isoform X2 [Amblyomma americanum]